MIERVARALCLNYVTVKCGWSEEERQAFADEFWRDYAGDARTAIEAMREPTEAMKMAPGNNGVRAGEYPMAACEAEEAWQAMIAVALKQ